MTIPTSRITTLATAFFVLACGSTKSPATSTDPSNPDDDPADLAIPATDSINNGRFTTSPACAQCHSNSTDADAMRDEDDREIAPYDLWQSTMMANAARDPLWRAVVSAEVAAHPDSKDAIEAKCMRCHAPAASEEARMSDLTMAMDLLKADSDVGNLGRDGVTCTVCHQIEADGLGSDTSFSGGFVTAGTGRIYGPHDDNFAMPMEHHTGFSPVHSEHTTSSELCATCHTLFTNPFDDQGAPTTVEFPEQTPYLEWQNSVFASGDEAATCQDCHVPDTSVDGQAITTAIARNPGGFDFGQVDDRSPYGRHIFVGGNTWIPAIIRDYADVLSPLASAAAFNQTIAAARYQLGNKTATVELSGLVRTADRLQLSVRIANLSGHKFPTGFPARRAWLELVVEDADGAVVFASGRTDSTGRLVDGAGQVLPSETAGGAILGHLQTLTSSDQVYVLEAIMANQSGNPTFTLLRAASYAKDNRLLPRGWSDQYSKIAQIAPVGTDGDADFTGGGDQLDIDLALASDGQLTVRARLLYQPVSARFLAELARWDTPEIRAFLTMLRAVGPSPEVVAEAQLTNE